MWCIACCSSQDSLEDLCLACRTSSCAVGSSSSTTPCPQVGRHFRIKARASRDAGHLPLASPKDQCPLHLSPWPALCRGRRVSRRPADSRATPISLPSESRAGWRHVVAEWQFLKAGEILKHRGQARELTPGGEIEIAQVGAVDFDSSLLRVVKPAPCNLARGWSCRTRVLPDDGQRRPGPGIVEVEALRGRARRPDRRRLDSRKRISAALASSSRVAAHFESKRRPEPSPPRGEYGGDRSR